jgi:hypothetical protein
VVEFSNHRFLLFLLRKAGNSTVPSVIINSRCAS